MGLFVSLMLYLYTQKLVYVYISLRIIFHQLFH
nr:MAG TPA: hypothetical protein [Caudoviricetes sp.]